MRGALIVVHRNIDMDAIVSAYMYYLKENICGVFSVNDFFVDFGEEDKWLTFTTEEHFEKTLGSIFDERDIEKIVVLDMPMKEELKKKIEELGIELEHYDHHDGSAPSTARILWKKFKDELPEWVKFLVELADYSDMGKILRQPAPVKYFHVTGLINALRTRGWTDIYILADMFEMLECYSTMLQKLVEAEKLVKDVLIIKLGRCKVAVVENKPHAVNQYLFEHEGVDFIIFKDGNNLGITRNAMVNKPDLNRLKPALEERLREKGKPEEFKEWFFHPAGFIVARGTRKHPAETPSVLTPQDLLELLSTIL